MRTILGALVALLIASTAAAQTSIEQRNQWRRQADEHEATAAGLRLAARCDMPDFPSGWTYRKEVTPTAAPGSTLTNIPVAVTISADSDISANALANGHDILFTDLTDGTTVYPSWRASYSAGTWKGFVLFPSYSSGGKCYVNYGNAAASDQSTTAALTGGGMVYYLDFDASDPTVGLQEVITGVTPPVTGSASVVAGPMPEWNAWSFAAGSGVLFTAALGNNLQPDKPLTRVTRYKPSGAGSVAFLTHRVSPVGYTQPWVLYSGGVTRMQQALTNGILTPAHGSEWVTVATDFETTNWRGWYNGSFLQTNSLSSMYALDSTAIGPYVIGAPTSVAQHAAFAAVYDANWHAFWHANTGTVSLSEQEEAVTAPPLSINGMCPVIRSNRPSATVSIRTPAASVTSRVLGASVIPGCN